MSKAISSYSSLIPPPLSLVLNCRLAALLSQIHERAQLLLAATRPGEAENVMSTQAPLELKKTINLPKTGFAQKANLAQTEPARMKRWMEAGLHDLIRRSREGREKFILHDGPPYANADIHLGTAMNKILK